MNRYQIQPVSSQQISSNIVLEDVGEAPNIILSVSPCRSGSSVLVRVFGAAGVLSYYQQLKSMLRWKMQGEDVCWKVPSLPHTNIFLKETLGPYTETEALFNPMNILLDAGYPPEKLRILILGRHPLNTWASWDKWWNGATSIDNFIKANITTEKIREQAEREGISVTTVVYEALKYYDADTVVKRMFGRFGIPYSPIAVDGWQTLPEFGTPGSHIHYREIPPIFNVPGILDSVRSADKLIYSSIDNDVTDFDENTVLQIQEAGLTEIYEKWKRECETHLRINVGGLEKDANTKYRKYRANGE
jgi:hypothetical protein